MKRLRRSSDKAVWTADGLGTLAAAPVKDGLKQRITGGSWWEERERLNTMWM